MSDPPGAPAPTDTIVVGGGCFWCTEAVFSDLNGVTRVLPGYAGGTVVHPSYEDVCTGRTGHAEVVEIAYQPSVLSLHDLLLIFLTTHDPTTRDRQGDDVGPQYRSVIFYRSPAEKATAEAAIREVDSERLYRHPIVTQVVPLSAFYPAEEYHREYFRRHPERAYCQIVIAPKVAKFRTKYASRLRGAPATGPG